MSRLRVGIVGAGFGANVHAPAFTLHERFEVVAIAAPSSAERAARERKIPHAFASTEAMLAGVELDVVAVASPPKEVREFGGREYVLEESITTDFAFVRAVRGDRFGNLVFHRSARNFNPLCAMAARTAIAEVEELVDAIDPDEVQLPGIFVERVVELTPSQAGDKPIEKRTVAP